MKILILNYEYPPLGGGAGVCTRYEAQELANLGHEVTILTAWFKGEKEIDLQTNLSIIRLKSRRKYTYKSNIVEMISWLQVSKKYLEKNCKVKEYDICIANFTIPGGVVAKYLKKTKQIPYIIISHGHDVPFFFPKQMLKYHILTYFWIKNIVLNSEKLVALSSMMKENADRFLGSKNLHKNIVIPNGCNSVQFFPEISKKTKEFTILFVGRLVEQKAPFTFLKALAILKKENFDFTAYILGDGDLKKGMEEFVIKNDLSKNVVFKGWVTKTEMLEHYQKCSVQVMSSSEEAMSIAVLEALSCGMYVISTPVSGNTDVIEKEVNGQFFDFENHIQLAQQLKKFHDNQFKKNYSVPNAYIENFRQNYDWKKIAGMYDLLLKELISTK